MRERTAKQRIALVRIKDSLGCHPCPSIWMSVRGFCLRSACQRPAGVLCLSSPPRSDCPVLSLFCPLSRTYAALAHVSMFGAADHLQNRVERVLLEEIDLSMTERKKRDGKRRGKREKMAKRERHRAREPERQTDRERKQKMRKTNDAWNLRPPVCATHIATEQRTRPGRTASPQQDAAL